MIIIYDKLYDKPKYLNTFCCKIYEHKLFSRSMAMKKVFYFLETF